MPVDKSQEPNKEPGSKKRGEYKVVFKGQLRDGFTKDKVIANIVKLTKISEEKIEKKFFSGKDVIIRRAHDEAQAQKLQQLFSKAGLKIVILKDDSEKTDQTKKLPEKKSKQGLLKPELIKVFKNTVKTHQRSLLFLALGMVFIAIGYLLWNAYQLSVDTPDEIVEIEQALANESLVFLAHVNAEHLLSLHSYFIDDPDALPGMDSSFYNNLKKSGIDPQKSIQQMLMAAYMSEKTLVTHSILLGDFSVASVKQFLLKHHHGELIDESDFVRIQIADIDPMSCKKGNFREVAIEPGRILISTDGYLDDLRRILKKESGNATDLMTWSDYRSDKLMSVAFFNPEQSAKLTPGLLALMAQGTIKKNKPLNSVYASIGMQLLPPSAIVDVSLNSQDQSWLEDTQTEMDKQLAQMKSDSQGLPNLLTMLNKISVNQDSSQLSVDLQLDGELKKSIELSINEFTDKFFSMGSSSSKGGGLASVPEQVDKQPVQFMAGYNKSRLKPFNEQFEQSYKPAWIEGPFAVGVEQLLFENEQVVLQLRAKGQNIHNIGSKQAKIKILAVNDASGNNVLAKQTCGASAESSDESYFRRWGSTKMAYVNNKMVHYDELEADHKVRLEPGVKFSRVKSLQAEIELELATQTRKERFALPKQNKVLSEYGSRLFFKPGGKNNLDYTISGDEKRVLAVRALNAKEQYLSQSSSSSMGSLWGSGRSISQDYYGEVAFVEVVYAVQMEKINYAVEIKKFPPYPMENHSRYNSEEVKLSSVEIWNGNYDHLNALDMTAQNNWHGEQQAQWHEGPFNLALYGLRTSKHWGTTGTLMIKTPVIDELRHNLSALEVYFKYPQVTESGERGKSYYRLLKANGYYMNGEFILDEKKPHMESQLSFSLPADKSTPDQNAIKEINGEIIVHLPVSRHTNKYTDLSIGAQWQDEGVKTRIIRLGNDVMEFEVSGSQSRLLQITLLDAENRRISTSDVHYGLNSGVKSKGAPEKGSIVVNYQGNPAKALLTVSEGQQARRYPFQLRVK